ncbi:fimbrial protein [Cronobacter dublinensis]
MKNILSLCLLFAIQYAHADSVMIHVTGNILGSTCMVDTDSRNMNVDMGEAMSGQFRKAGSTGEWVDFQL